MFNEPPLNVGTPASFQSYPQPSHTTNAHSTSPYFTNDQRGQSGLQFQGNAAHQGGLGATLAGQSQSTTYGSGFNAQTQDTQASIHNFSQNQAHASSFSEAHSAPPVSYEPNSYAAHQPQSQSQSQTQLQPPTGNAYQSQPNTGDAINFQALLDHLSPSSNALPSPSQSQNNVSSLPAAPNLPPRPPPQENHNQTDDIRSYHPHSQKPANSSFQGSNQLQPLSVRTGDVHSSARTNPSPSTPGQGQPRSSDTRSVSPDEDRRWPPEINKLYEDFLDEERKFVTNGQWDQFPVGSRLFIGNLPTEKVTKRDIFHRFYQHGQLAQISIKQAYGFVQFLESSSCYRALQAEQGQQVRGRKMHLEVSKPQRNTKKADASTNERSNGARRRSRSPDYSRGGTGPQPRNVDRYTGGQNPLSPRDRDNRRFRDDYRYPRSPTPPRGGRGGRGRDRSRDRYDDRRKSRSRSPRRYRSPSPRRDFDEDDLPLPHRAPHQIPDVQVLVVNEGLPRDFIRWVENSFRQQGLRCDVLILSPRLSEAAVIKRQVLEGVLAIVLLSTATLTKSKVNLQIFDRRGGADNVKFNAYDDLDPTTAAALVLQAKQTQNQPLPQPVQPPPSSAYPPNYALPHTNVPNFANPPPIANQFGQIAPGNPALSSIISSLDSNTLSQLLGAMAKTAPTQALQSQVPGQIPDLARLLGSAPVQPPAQNTHYGGPAVQSTQTYPNAFQNQSLAALLQAPAPPQSNPPASHAASTPSQMPSGQPDMNEIMAQLAKYKR